MDTEGKHLRSQTLAERRQKAKLFKNTGSRLSACARAQVGNLRIRQSRRAEIRHALSPGQPPATARFGPRRIFHTAGMVATMGRSTGGI